VANDTQTKPSRPFLRIPNRILVVLLIAAIVWAVGQYAPILPHIQVAAEPIVEDFVTIPGVGPIDLTNTLIAIFIADLLLILLAFNVWRAMRRKDPAPGGVTGLVVMLIEGLYSMTESTAGKHAGKIFPIMATIFLVVLTNNWLEMLPGVDTIGKLHEVHGEAEGYPLEELFKVGSTTVYTIVQESTTPVDDAHDTDMDTHADDGTADMHEEDGTAETHEEDGDMAHAGDEHGETLYGIYPFVRAAATDLNFTASLALISVVATQIVGLWTVRLEHAWKFFQWRGFAKNFGNIKSQLGPFDAIMPFLDLFVGILELIAEFAKILSFAFRLFGNVFAGAVLLFVLGTLVPFLQFGIVLFELFIGAIQAFVFAMLTLVFMSMATVSHAGHDEAH
jgi:F-type H+-transporting ATPase subunit a